MKKTLGSNAGWGSFIHRILARKVVVSNVFLYFQPDPWVEIQFSPLALVDGFIFEIMIQFDSSICFEMG